MKSKILLPVVFLCLIITSCNWQIPEKITVKAEPVYKFTAGTIEPQLGDDLNFKSIIKDMMDSGDDTFADAWFIEDAGLDAGVIFNVLSIPSAIALAIKLKFLF